MARRIGVIGKPGGIKNTRVRIPADVQAIALSLPADDPRRLELIGADGRPKANLVRSTRRVDRDDADAKAADFQAHWKGVFADLRQRPDPDALTEALTRIDRWRRSEVKAATGFDIKAMLAAMGATTPPRSPRQPGDGVDMSVISRTTAPGLTTGGVVWAESYFAGHQAASRAPEVDFLTFQLIDRLETMQGERWRDIDGFDARLKDVIGAVPPRVLGHVRPAFAAAWAEVLAAQERERQHAATILAVVSDYGTREPLIPRTTYRPVAGDKTVGQLLDAYRAVKKGKDVVGPARAVRQFIGEDVPVRAVSKTDARRFAEFVRRIPASASLRYPGLTLTEAADKADKDGRPRLSPASANRYLTYASMFWNWGLKEDDGWADKNPFYGLADTSDDEDTSVDRRGLTDAELGQLFSAVAKFKAADGAVFWVCALLLSGMRLSEACQALTTDIRTTRGIHSLKIHVHDATGRPDPLKRLKTPESKREVPIHKVTLDAGFMAYVERRRAAGEVRLFDAKPHTDPENGRIDWGHYMSKRINSIIDKTVTKDPDAVAHSLRHGFRERGRAAHMPSEILDRLGGWAAANVGAAYGQSGLETLASAMAKIKYPGLAI